MLETDSVSSQQTNNFASPFEHFFRTQNSNTEMLYEAVPYVSMQFKKPLALFLKFQEFQQILSGFDDEETLQACGLCEPNTNLNAHSNNNIFDNHSSHSSIEEMLTAMRKKATTPIAEKLDLILTIFKAEKIMATYQKYMASQPINSQDTGNNDLFTQILPLLLTNANTSHTDLIHLAEQIQNAAKGAVHEPKLAN